MRKARNLLKIAAVYVGTVVGAGFASGQELILFFVRFSKRGILGCFIAAGLFCFLGALVLSKASTLPQKTHRRYLQSVFFKPLASFLAMATEIFLCVSFCVMLSGSGAFFMQHFSLPAMWGVLLTDAICLLAFCYDLKGLSLVNVVLTPFIILGTVYVALYMILTDSRSVWLPQVSSHGVFFPYALFYVGYNLLTASAVLVPASAIAEDKKTAALGGVLGGAMLGVMALICCLALRLHESVWSSQLPLLLLSKRAGHIASSIYAGVLYMAMLTTAVSTGFSVVQSMQHMGMGKRPAAFLVCLLAIPLSAIEFSVLVRYCYVFFGVLGVLMVGGILWDWYKKTP